MDIKKIITGVQEIASEVKIDKVVKKAPEVSQEVAESIVEKTASDALTAQGKAMISTKIADKTVEVAKKVCPGDKLADARKAVKKAPLPQGYKGEVLSGINAEIESRHLTSQQTGISKDEWIELCTNSPKAKRAEMEARKEALQAQYGDALTTRKETLRRSRNFSYLCNSNESAMRQAKILLGSDKVDMKAFRAACRDPKKAEKLTKLMEEARETGKSSDYLSYRTSLFLEQISDEDLLKIKDSRESFGYSGGAKIFFETLNAELELRAVKKAGGKKAEESAEFLKHLYEIQDTATATELAEATGRTRKEVLQERVGDQLKTRKAAQQAEIDEYAPLARMSESDIITSETMGKKDRLIEQFAQIRDTMKEYQLSQTQAKDYLALRAKYPDMEEWQGLDIVRGYTNQRANALLNFSLEGEENPSFAMADMVCGRMHSRFSFEPYVVE